jgi:hypothetical protein
MDGMFLPATKWIAKAIEQQPSDKDFHLLSVLLSAMDHWSLLAKVWDLCWLGMCRATNPFQLHVEYKVALELSGNLEEAQHQLFLAQTVSNMTRYEVLQEVTKYYMISRQNQKAAQDIPDKNSERHQDLLLKTSASLERALHQHISRVDSKMATREMKSDEWPVVPIKLMEEVHGGMYQLTLNHSHHWEGLLS